MDLRGQASDVGFGTGKISIPTPSDPRFAELARRRQRAGRLLGSRHARKIQEATREDRVKLLAFEIASDPAEVSENCLRRTRERRRDSAGERAGNPMLLRELVDERPIGRRIGGEDLDFIPGETHFKGLED